MVDRKVHGMAAYIHERGRGDGGKKGVGRKTGGCVGGCLQPSAELGITHVEWVYVHHLGLFPINDMRLISHMLCNCRLGQVPACKCSPVLFQLMIQCPAGLANIHFQTCTASDPVDHTCLLLQWDAALQVYHRLS